MYSLYSAWLTTMSGGMPDAPPASPPPPSSMSLNLSSAPPTSTTPSAAPDVHLQVGATLTNFSAHRHVLAAHSGFFKAALSTLSTGPILVPNVQMDEFSSLLTFMYTGYLDLNFANIYNILLGTHILHMPRALDLCRSFLMQAQQQHQQQLFAMATTSTALTNIIKPIPSRKPLRQFEPAAEPAAASTSGDVVAVAEPPPCLSETPRIVQSVKKRAKLGDSGKADEAAAAPGQQLPPATRHDAERTIIIDIACCDGPVRFHRVLNKHYGQAEPAAAAIAKRTLISEQQAMNKAMSATIALDCDVPEGKAASSGELYTCLYCKHTFKSQYCYQKHARRHLNPVDAPLKLVENGDVAVDAPPTRKRGEFKLLDMNVQYYPCKTCGSKFPSYYFVHKHRKLCHADEMADGSNKNNEIVQVKPTLKENHADGKTDSRLPHSPPSPHADDATVCSDIIDVEDTNTG